MLLIEVEEAWDWNLHHIVTPDKMCLFLFILILEPSCLLIEANSILDRVWNTSECLCFISPEHSFLHDFNAIHCLQFAWRYLNRL
jgi:hypothetical protein